MADPVEASRSVLVITRDHISDTTTVELEGLEEDDGCPCHCHCSLKTECFMKYGDDGTCDPEDTTVCHCWHNDCFCSMMIGPMERGNLDIM